MEPANEARGEVPLKIGDVELVVAAELGGLAALSSRLQCQSLSDLWGRLTAMEVNAVMAGVACLTVRGDKEAALQKLKLRHFKLCQDAFMRALNHQMDEAGNGEAAKGSATA